MARFRDQNTYSGCPTGLEPRRGREGVELKLKEAPTLRVLRVQGRCPRTRLPLVLLFSSLPLLFDPFSEEKNLIVLDEAPVPGGVIWPH